MSKYYKAEDVETALVFYGLCDGKTCGEVKEVLNSIPTIDIVRCKECKRWGTDDCFMCNECQRNPYPTKPDDFCSYGEREDE